MSENHDTLISLCAQTAELCRRMDALQADMRAEQAETREEMRRGFARLDARYNGAEDRLRIVEANDVTRKEQLSTWRLWAAGMTVLSGIVAGLISFGKEIVGLFR